MLFALIIAPLDYLEFSTLSLTNVIDYLAISLDTALSYLPALNQYGIMSCYALKMTRLWTFQMG